MRFLFVLEHYAPYLGGAEKLFQQLTRALAAAGHTVTVVTTRFRPDLPKEETLAGVRVHRVDCRNRFLFTVLAIPAALRAARSADVVHTTTYTAAPAAWLAAKIRGKRSVITVHEYWGPLWQRLPFLRPWQAGAYRLFERFVVGLPFDHYVTVSDFTARTLVQSVFKKQWLTQRSLPRTPLLRIHNGLDYTQIPRGAHRPDPGFNYVYYGRLGVSKGLDLLLPAAAILRETHPEARLRLVIPRVPAALYRTILSQLDALALTDVVDLFHELPYPELQALILRSSCAVIPSYSEGFCFAAAEAVAMGVPVVSSGRGALVETVGGQYLEMPEQSVAGLVECLHRAAAGDWNWRPAPVFPLQTSVEAYLRFYSSWSEPGPP